VYGFAIDPGPEGTVYAGTPAGVYRSNDHGITWTLVYVNSDGLEGALAEIAIDPTATTTLYGSRGGANLPNVVKSIDAGRTWLASNTGIPPGQFLRIAVDPTNPSTIYGGGDWGVFKSADAGSTWSLVSQGVPSVSALAIDSTDSRRVYASSYNGPVFATFDAGASWRAVLQGGQPMVDVVVDPNDSSKVYAAAYCCGTIWKSFDRGESWERLPGVSTQIEDLFIVRSDSRTLYAAAHSGPLPPLIPPIPGSVIRSADEGNTWTAFDIGIEFHAIRRVAADSTGRFLIAVPSAFDGTFVYEIQAAADVPVPTLSGTGFLVFAILLAGLGLLTIGRNTIS
jgi:photosystem II stability/assembly factor-like uncharacterized protein